MSAEKRLRRRLLPAEKELLREKALRQAAENMVHIQRELLDMMTDQVPAVACAFAFDVGMAGA